MNLIPIIENGPTHMNFAVTLLDGAGHRVLLTADAAVCGGRPAGPR